MCAVYGTYNYTCTHHTQASKTLNECDMVRQDECGYWRGRGMKENCTNELKWNTQTQTQPILTNYLDDLKWIYSGK